MAMLVPLAWRRARSPAAYVSLRISRASRRNDSPSSVSATSRVVRMKRDPPSSSSKDATCLDTVGCERCNSSAARRKLRFCATWTKHSSCVVFT